MHNNQGLSGADWGLALLVIMVWGVNFVVMKWGLQEISPLLLCALRFLAASLPFIFFVKRPANLSWGILAAYGLVQGVGQFGLLFVGLQLGMPAGMASVVLQTQAFMTLLLAALWLGARPHRWQWIGLCIAIVGLITIANSSSNSTSSMTLLGFLYTLGAAAMWAISNLITRNAAKNGPYEPIPFLVWSSLFPVLPLLLMSVWLEGGVSSMQAQLLAITWKGIGAVIYLALLSTLLGYGLWTRLLQRYPASTVAPLSLLVPVIGLFSAIVLLAEVPTILQWLGIGAVLLGMMVNQLGGRLFRR